MIEKIIFCENAKQIIKEELQKYSDVETGGVLLGYFSECEIKIVEVITGGEGSIRKTGSFTYDSDYVEEECNRVSREYVPNLQLVGLWHKHNHTLEPAFSMADIDMHMQVLQEGRGVSCLFQKRSDDEYQLQVMMNQEQRIRKEPWY